ncbi:innexin shaking-B [Nephila pilipes]|uniref:Innexin n=1 Tax=Nephila pilipes TaxID=299642 RepID=A0A8X6MNC6_NEPPI|nr:innexin shaking-B [Nephila pilipes]
MQDRCSLVHFRLTTMIHMLSALKSLLKSKKLHIDHWAFRLHYRFTVLFLLLFCIVVSTKQYAGDPIRCSKDTREYSTIVENYCFITSTYTVKTALNLTVSEGAPHPGIYPTQDEQQFRYHRYYQWVGFILFIQAVFFYVPHWLWKIFEGGKLSSLLERDTKYLPREEQVKSRNMIVEHLRSRWTKDKLFVVKYLLCEIWCFINLFGQMTFLDTVFEHEYFCFGFEVLNHYRNGSPPRTDPFQRMFPKVTSCTYRYFGEGGKIRSESVLCVLAVNVMNEKIFLFLWFWFMMLSVVTFCALVFKIVVFSVTSLRLTLLCARFPNIRADDFKVIVETGNLSNYLFVYLLGQNMDEAGFLDAIEYFVTMQRGKLN